MDTVSETVTQTSQAKGRERGSEEQSSPRDESAWVQLGQRESHQGLPPQGAWCLLVSQQTDWWRGKTSLSAQGGGAGLLPQEAEK